MIVVGMVIFFSGVVTGKLLLLPEITSHPGSGKKPHTRGHVSGGDLLGRKDLGEDSLYKYMKISNKKKFRGKMTWGKLLF